jgi:iron(III) transport system ATP-binding protein
MSTVEFRNIIKRYGALAVLQNLNLRVEDGEFLVLLGPSGCGKTTTLRCLAGLETPDEGRISFGAHDVFDSTTGRNLSADKRNIGMVFQSYALWPHMTVRKNIAYPLKARRLRATSTDGWVEDTATLVDCQKLLDRYPAQLSGGQQQRVALARGLVARPDVVLFDEPLSNLDARLRDLVRAQLHELHVRLRFSAVFVTHDQSEALALADRLAIMRLGRFEQVGSPEEVFEHPATEYVADFIGMSNRLVFEHLGDAWTFDTQPIPGAPAWPVGHPHIVARLRPEDVQLAPPGATGRDGLVRLPAEVVDSQFGGRHMDVVVLAGGVRAAARVPAAAHGGWARHLGVGAPVTLEFDPAAAVFYDPAGLRVSTDSVEAVAPTVASAT